MVIFWVRTVSTLPAASHERNFTVVVARRVSGPVYVGLLSVGVVPFVVKCVLATPEPPVSTAASVTVAEEE
jgi:hypothetical protein